MDALTRSGLILSVALTFAGGRPSAPRPMGSVAVPAFGPGVALPGAVADDGSVMHSMAEGGISALPLVVDGTVRQVTEHSVLIDSGALGSEHLYVVPRTRVTVDGRGASLAEVRPGMRIRAACGAAETAMALEVEGGA